MRDPLAGSVRVGVKMLMFLKLKFRKYPSIYTQPFYNIIIIFDTVVTQKRNIEHEKQ